MIKYDNIKYFDEPIYKKITEIQQGDVIYTEFGDYAITFKQFLIILKRRNLMYQRFLFIIQTEDLMKCMDF